MIVYEQFDSAVAKQASYICRKDEKKVGGHAVLAVGYDDKSERFIVMNLLGPLIGVRTVTSRCLMIIWSNKN